MVRQLHLLHQLPSAFIAVSNDADLVFLGLEEQEYTVEEADGLLQVCVLVLRNNSMLPERSVAVNISTQDSSATGRQFCSCWYNVGR